MGERNDAPAWQDAASPGGTVYQPNAAFERALQAKAALDHRLWGRGRGN